MRDSVDELDLALINAIQVRPRAPWSQLAAALGIDAATAARRWQRLTDAGLAWVTCAAGPARHPEFCLAYIDIDCAPGSLAAITDALAERDPILYLYHRTGGPALLAVLVQPGPAAVSAYLRTALEPLPGVRGYRCELRTVGYSEATRWRLHSLEPEQQRVLQHPVRSSRDPQSRPSLGPGDAVDDRLYRLLHEDGRMPYTELAARAGLSEPTARRRVGRLLAARQLRLRCDVAQSITGTPVTAIVRATVPAAGLDAAGHALAALPQVRLCAALTGPANLLLMAWLPALHDLPALEAALPERAPGLVVTERAISLRTVKQLGRLLDGDGRAVRHIPPGPEALGGPAIRSQN
jgi:DNA-binding Lrp family transcriptional regulator